MEIEAKTQSETDLSALIDVDIHYRHSSDTYRVHVDKVTDRFTVFKDGITRTTMHAIQNDTDHEELQELAILVCIMWPGEK